MEYQHQAHQQLQAGDSGYSPATWPATSDSYKYSATDSQYQYDAKDGQHIYTTVSMDQPDYHPGAPSAATSQAQAPTQGFLNQQQAVKPWSTCLWEWAQEIGWVVFSILMLITLVAVLSKFDGGPMPRWSLGLTLNTVVALLSTLARSAFIIPCVESVSQLKWIWFRRERPLGHFQIFDEASRGPWGTMKLLFVTKGWIFSFFPAVLLLSATLTATLTQSVVTYETRLSPVTDQFIATVPRSIEYFYASANQLSGMINQNAILQSVDQALSTPSTDEYQLPLPACSVSECRWPIFSSLAVCFKTWNITDRLTVNPVNITSGVNATLPGGAYVLSGAGYTRMNVSERRALSYNNESMPQALVISNFHIISAMATADARGFTVRATEVLFHACANRYNASIASNMARRDLVSSSVATVSPVFVRYLNRTVNDTALASPDDPSKGYYFGGTPVMLMKGAMTSRFPGYWSDSNSPPSTVGSAAEKYGQALRFGTNITDAKANEIIGNITRNVATGLSKMVLDPRDTLTGTAMAPETYVRVRWGWLAFIAAQIAMSIAILVSAIVKTRTARIGSVKSSALALLFAIPSDEKWRLEQGASSEQKELGKVVAQSAGVVGRFAPATKGWSLR